MILLRHISENDVVEVTRYITNPEVARFLTWKPYTNNADILKYFEYTTKCCDFPDEIFCILFNDNIIGTAHLLKREGGDTQIGFGIVPEFWNKGLGHEIAQKIIEYIKYSRWSRETKRVIAVIHKDNVFAQKIFVKLKFSLGNDVVRKDFKQYKLNILR